MSDTPIADQMRQQLRKQAGKSDAKEELRGIFNEAGVKAMKAYLSGIETGAIRIEDSTDAYRLFQMYMQLNDLNDGTGLGGSLPSLPKSQENLFKDMIETEVDYDSDEREVDVVNLDTFSDMSDEEFDKMMQQRERELNDSNERGEMLG